MLGPNCLLVHYFYRLVDVSAWHASDGSIYCPTIYGDISYGHPISGKFYIIVHYQVIHFTRLANHLTCPIQIQISGVRINELSKFLAEDTYENTHAIIIDEPLNPTNP